MGERNDLRQQDREGEKLTISLFGRRVAVPILSSRRQVLFCQRRNAKRQAQY